MELEPQAERQMTTNDTGGRTVKSVETTFEIVEHLAGTGSARLCDVAADLDLADSTVHKHLATLARDGYVVKDGDEYRLGMRFLDVGGRARSQHSIYRVAKRTVDDLADETGERAQFIMEEDGRGYYLHVTSGEQAVRTDARPGKRIYLHSNASGKAILAHMSRDRVVEIVDRWGLVPSTDNTIVDEDELYDELDEVRERGYALNDMEYIEGLRGIAAPVTHPDGHVLGSLSVGGPYNRMPDERLETELANKVLGAANEIELRLKFDGVE